MSQIKVDLIDHMGSDLTVVNAARVSFDKESEWNLVSDNDPTEASIVKVLSDRDAKLINYLAKHKHISPFGHCFLSFRVTAPVFVARQLVKHKFLRWNEVSRRYVDDAPEFYQPTVWRGRAENAKQGSSEVIIGDVENTTFDMSSWDDNLGYLYYAEFTHLCGNLYKRMLSDGVCPEQARMVLPQSMMTSWYWSGSLDAFVDMCRLRLDPHAQRETREVAECIAERIAELYPVSWSALMNTAA